MKKDYSKATIYKLVNKFDTNEKMIYIGTTTNWPVRKYQHHRRCNDETDRGYNWKIYKYIRKTGGFENWDMKIIEDCPCSNSIELSRRERYYIEIYNAKLNTTMPNE